MKKLGIIGLFLFLGACASKKDIAYLGEQTIGENSILNTYEPKVQVDDELSIIVSAENPELTAQFNLPFIQQNFSPTQNQADIRTYLVDKEGNIDFPILGKLTVAGMTRIELTSFMKEKVEKYIKNPIINVRILNFKYTVLGEVMRPGPYLNQGERVSVLEGLSNAGDLTIYGSRKNVLLIREENGKRITERLDLTNKDLLTSEYYYLRQNDIIYVEPNKTRVNSSVVGPNVTVWLSIASIIISILVLTAR